MFFKVVIQPFSSFSPTSSFFFSLFSFSHYFYKGGWFLQFYISMEFHFSFYWIVNFSFKKIIEYQYEIRKIFFLQISLLELFLEKYTKTVICLRSVNKITKINSLHSFLRGEIFFRGEKISYTFPLLFYSNWFRNLNWK